MRLISPHISQWNVTGRRWDDKDDLSLTGGSVIYCLRSFLDETRMPMDCVILAAWTQRRVEILESFWSMGQHHSQSVSQNNHP